jgi:hypothetical protein
MTDRQAVVRRRLRKLFIVIAVLLIARWGLIAGSRSQLQGTVLDDASERPVAGAVVVAVRYRAGFHGTTPERSQIAETLTDGTGHFDLALESRSLLRLLFLSTRYGLVVVHPEYMPVMVNAYADFESVNQVSMERSGHLRVRIRLLDGDDQKGVATQVAWKLADLYVHVPPNCPLVEVPQLTSYLVEMGAIRREWMESMMRSEGANCENWAAD